MQQVVDMGRIPLNDDDGQRVSDQTMLTYARNAIHLLLARRSDLFFGMFTAMPSISTLALTDAFPLDDMVAPAVADYCTARAESGNDESVIEQRATMFFSLFKEGAL